MTKDLDRREFLGIAMAAVATPLFSLNEADLAEDPHTVNPNRIKDIEIVRTVVGGETMHEH